MNGIDVSQWQGYINFERVKQADNKDSDGFMII